MELTLIRHAEMTGDPFCCPGPGVDDCLSARGIAQAEALGRALADERYDLVLASPYGRARQTAEIAFRGSAPGIEILPWLHEWLPDRSLEDLPPTEAGAMNAAVEALPADQLWQTELGESTLAMLDRVGPPFCARLAEAGVERRFGGYVVAPGAEDLRIAVVAHGGSLSALLTFLLGIPPFPVGMFAFEHTGLLRVQLRRRGEVWYPAIVAGAPVAPVPAATCEP